MKPVTHEALSFRSWLLHEITTLSEISSVRLKLLVKQVLSRMLQGTLDYAKVLKFTTPKDSDSDISMTKGAVSAVHFVALPRLSRRIQAAPWSP